MTKLAFYRMLLFVAATGATGCRCSDDAAPQAGQFRALPPNTCTLKDIPGCTMACELGDVQACATLGFIYLQRDNLDFVKAEAANQKACDSGMRLSCIRAAESILGQVERRSEWSKAVALFKSTCDEGDHYGCYNLGKVHEAGKTMPADKEKAIELYTKACNREEGYFGGCVRLWVATGHAMPWKSRKGPAIACMEDLGDCPPEKK